MQVTTTQNSPLQKAASITLTKIISDHDRKSSALYSRTYLSNSLSCKGIILKNITFANVKALIVQRTKQISPKD